MNKMVKNITDFIINQIEHSKLGKKINIWDAKDKLKEAEKDLIKSYNHYCWARENLRKLETHK